MNTKAIKINKEVLQTCENKKALNDLKGSFKKISYEEIAKASSIKEIREVLG